MTTPQDHEMEFWGASKYRRKRREHRTPGNSGEPCEHHDTGYDGEEEDPDHDRFDDAGDQFTRHTPQEENNEDMFGDKGGQYSDEAEEGGDKLDSNDLYPDHEAEPRQEGMEDSENAHQASPPICSFRPVSLRMTSISLLTKSSSATSTASIATSTLSTTT
jgi:hypothetical protein